MEQPKPEPMQQDAQTQPAEQQQQQEQQPAQQESAQQQPVQQQEQPQQPQEQPQQPQQQQQQPAQQESAQQQPVQQQPPAQAAPQGGAAPSSGATDAAPASNGPAPPAVPQPAPPPNPMVDRYNDQWTAVQNNPSDFAAWTTLIGVSEKLDDIARIRAVYEPFLAAFPLCYGYWKKYADAEHRHGNVEAALQVYDRGVTATPHSLDLWGHYAAYRKANGGTPDEVRSVYERGVGVCSSDYLAHSLWDKYIHYEEEQGAGVAVTALYSRVLQCPLRELPRYMQSLKSFVQGRAASEIMPQEEMEALMSSLQAQKEQQAAAAAQAQAPEGEAPPAVADTSVSDEDIKAAWLAKREEYMAAAKAVADDRKPFEESIKRTYFHVKPLDSSQLANWVRYLDHMESKKDASVSDVATVYERCLVPCASYPEFWERYVRWLEGKGMEAEARGALQRQVEVFCKTRPEAHLFAARFEERHGRVQEARMLFAHLTGHMAPRLLQVVVAAANFERRQGQLDAACTHYESLLNSEKAKDGEGGSKLYPFLAMQYANFLKQSCGNADKGREVLRAAVDSSPHIRQLWEAALLFEESCGTEGLVERVLPLYEKAVAEQAQQPSESGKKGLNEKDREELSLRAIDFADAYADAHTLHQVMVRHSALFQLPTSIAASASAAANAADAASSRKRPAETAADASAKVPKVDAVSTPAAAAAAAPVAAAAPAAPPVPAPVVPAPVPVPVASAPPPVYPAYPGYPPASAAPPAYPGYPAGYPSYPYAGGYYGYGY
ncbi:hypothetical protein DUNSADRAFT_16564 [Dunaliella salina]|uniref:Suppressor of forked domain-containing protein n=1 Tax=Dunaliella salina TaxID=3046 RepID=A0ABQ7H0T7_DUNSA|nr:hypothetical protein DUNSADRAFT_16564 [Dunaliella salina]|eukprot:KAF5840473.1 hypothetical protein DUNSADRAFT_16564 [Dunaliella salina]